MRPDLNSTVADGAAVARRPRGRLLGLGLVIALAALFTAPAAHAADRIYWSNYETNQIAWANLNGDGGGGTVNTTGATVDGPMGLAADPSRGLIYWVNWSADRGTTISYAHLDGSGAGDLAITGTTIDAPHGLAIDPTAGTAGTPLLAQSRRQRDLLGRPRRRRGRRGRRAADHDRDRRRTARADDRPAHRPHLLVELRRGHRDDDLLPESRRHRRRRPARHRPARRGPRGDGDRPRHQEDLLVRFRPKAPDPVRRHRPRHRGLDPEHDRRR